MSLSLDPLAAFPTSPSALAISFAVTLVVALLFAEESERRRSARGDA